MATSPRKKQPQKANGISSPPLVEFPFKCTLSLHRLIEYWKLTANGKECSFSALAKKVLADLSKSPELLEPIKDRTLLANNRSVLDLLLSPVFAPASWHSSVAAAIEPFSFRSFYATPLFEQMRHFEDGKVNGKLNLDDYLMSVGRVVHAYTIILRHFYQIDIPLDYPIVATVVDRETGLERHYRWSFDPQFVEIKLHGELPLLTDDKRRRLLQNPLNVEVWYEILPPELFEFCGFTIFHAHDVTDQEVLSSLKFRLLEEDAITTTAGFQILQQKIRAFLRRPEVSIGLAVLPWEKHHLHELGRGLVHSFLFNGGISIRADMLEHSAYEQVVKGGAPTAIDDLTFSDSPIDQHVARQGIRNLVVAPLLYRDEVIGILEVGSPVAAAITSISALRLKEICPLLATAVKRNMDELNSRVQAVIKEKCTAIHPSVEWKFRHAALHFLDDRRPGAEMEPIVFEDVHPLYGLTDIRNSSVQRNAAIQQDISSQLNLALKVVRTAFGIRKLPIFDQLGFRIEQFMKAIQDNLSSGDEMSIVRFLQKDVESLFPHLQDFGDGVTSSIESYRNALDPIHKVVYRRRRDFDESVTRINDAIALFIEQEETSAQAMFPHYFEKYKTDGVEHGLYIGASLLEGGTYDSLYLKNLRLWQLLLVCGIARITQALKGSLPIPLETSHLILVQDTPLAIRFRMDEKKFDVDGAYNIRYEIMKKRIDKATIRGKKERVTQPGMLAVVYSQAKEAVEYRQYLDYLLAKKYLHGSIEELDVEDLQGIHGLKAMRVQIDVNHAAIGQFRADNAINEAVNAVTQLVN